MTLADALEAIREDSSLAGNVTFWKTIPAGEGSFELLPEWLHPSLAAALAGRGIENLYEHQARALESVRQGRNVVVATPTASGKSLCAHIPVLQALLDDPEAATLYLFPTKALSRDQVLELEGLAAAVGLRGIFPFDGDTPSSSRAVIRRKARILATNPDMLHAGILPHHPRWARFFRNLRYVVVDEIHQYRGVFGGHVANVIRRLRRVCRFYSGRPIFICASATIANPAELCRAVIGDEVSLVDRNGSPSGRRHFVLYNPPLVDRERGIRAGTAGEAVRLAEKFLDAGLQCLVFAGSRLGAEVLLGRLREAERASGRAPGLVRGYRGGYLPKERREIERGLKEGRIRAVVSTNALELGVDIGSLDVSILSGYPGSISSTWQQAGRAGRRAGESAAVLVADGSPLDQFLVNHPRYFFGRPPEHGVIDPDNLLLLVSHLRCAAFELPFTDDEVFGGRPLGELFEYLEEEGSLHRSGSRWHWLGEGYPAAEVSLRSASASAVAVCDASEGGRVIGEVDAASAPALVHPGAVYLQDGRSYLITELDLEGSRALAEPADTEWFTRAEAETSLEVLETVEEERASGWTKGYGQVEVGGRVTGYRKIDPLGRGDMGREDLDLPLRRMQTTSFWLAPDEERAARLWRESGVAADRAMEGLATLLLTVAPLFIMADSRDLRATVRRHYGLGGRAGIFIWDNVPGGAGYSRAFFLLTGEILKAARRTLADCRCAEGCPSCVGARSGSAAGSKKATGRLLRMLLKSE